MSPPPMAAMTRQAQRPGEVLRGEDSRPLPAGYFRDFDQNYQEWYYVDSSTGVSSWTHPLDERHPSPSGLNARQHDPVHIVPPGSSHSTPMPQQMSSPSSPMHFINPNSLPNTGYQSQQSPIQRPYSSMDQYTGTQYRQYPNQPGDTRETPLMNYGSLAQDLLNEPPAGARQNPHGGHNRNMSHSDPLFSPASQASSAPRGPPPNRMDQQDRSFPPQQQYMQSPQQQNMGMQSPQPNMGMQQNLPFQQQSTPGFVESQALRDAKMRLEQEARARAQLQQQLMQQNQTLQEQRNMLQASLNDHERHHKEMQLKQAQEDYRRTREAFLARSQAARLAEQERRRAQEEEYQRAIRDADLAQQNQEIQTVHEIARRENAVLAGQAAEAKIEAERDRRLAMRERIQTAMYTRQSMLQERFNAMEQSRLDDIAARATLAGLNEEAMMQALGNQVYRSKVEQNYALRRLERQINQRLQSRGYDLAHLGAYNNYSFDNLYNQSYFDDLMHDPGFLEPGYSRTEGLGLGSADYGGLGDRGLGYGSGLGSYDGFGGGLASDRLYDGGIGGIDSYGMGGLDGYGGPMDGIDYGGKTFGANAGLGSCGVMDGIDGGLGYDGMGTGYDGMDGGLDGGIGYGNVYD